MVSTASRSIASIAQMHSLAFGKPKTGSQTGSVKGAPLKELETPMGIAAGRLEAGRLTRTELAVEMLN